MNYGNSRARTLASVWAVLACIRRLRESPQYLLAILQRTNESLRKYPRFSAKLPQTMRGKNKILAREIPYSALRVHGTRQKDLHFARTKTIKILAREIPHPVGPTLTDDPRRESRRRENIVGVNMVLAYFVKLKQVLRVLC